MQKPAVAPNKKTENQAVNWILISELGFLVDFRPKMASERTARLTYVFFADADNSFYRSVSDYLVAHGANFGTRPTSRT
jgi:hypothetical protein